MYKRLLFVCLALVVLPFPDEVYAQFTDPRNYNNSPVGLNQIELDYAYARSNASVDTSLVVAGAKLSLNAGTIDFTRYFGFIHRMSWVEAAIPLAGLGGSVAGTNIHGSSSPDSLRRLRPRKQSENLIPHGPVTQSSYLRYPIRHLAGDWET